MFVSIMLIAGIALFFVWAMLTGALVVSIKRIVTGPRRRYHLLTAIYLGILAVYPVMAALMSFKLNGIEKSKVGAAMGDLGAFNSALVLYRNDAKNGYFPASMTQLLNDTAAGWAGPYLAAISPDPWNNQYTYTSDGNNYTILSIHDSENDKSETIRYCFPPGVMESRP